MTTMRKNSLEAQLAEAEAKLAERDAKLKDAISEIEELKAEPSAPSCFECRNGDHDDCGGPESGCGCAARGH